MKKWLLTSLWKMGSTMEKCLFVVNAMNNAYQRVGMKKGDRNAEVLI